MGLQSCRGKLLLVIILVGVMVIADSILIARVLRSGETMKNTTYPAVDAACEMQLAITQVQQFLSDVSATRAQDGLDSGFSEAQEQAERFKEARARYQAIHPEKEQVLREYDKAFDEYYALGKRMANEYVKDGPGGGNKLMKEFDERAERLEKYSETIKDESEAQMQQGLAELDVQMKLALLVMVLSGAVIMAVIFVVSRSIVRSLGLSCMRSNAMTRGKSGSRRFPCRRTMSSECWRRR